MTKKPDEDRLLEHEYDGIHEYDNPMPAWWVWLFWATIVFAILYWINVPGISSGRGRIANYQADMARAKAQQEALAARQPKFEVSEASLIALSHDPVAMDKARALWTNNCFACHLADGGGQIGPNLTDEYWIHGGKPMDIHRTIDQGVLDKGMPVWGKTLPPDQVAVLAAYVLTLRGTHPANPKAPQGVKAEEPGEEGPEARQTEGEHP
jgi:cytochrome c oxidase cbb3-type subunit 3